MTSSSDVDDLRRRVRDALDESRARTLALLDLPEDDQVAQHSPLMSPMVWDLAHIGNYEELWLLRSIDGRPPVDTALDDLYNAFEHPRWERPSLPILGPDDARRYIGGVRDEVLALLDRADLHADDELMRDAFVYGMVIQHEHQHDETLLATHQLMLDRAGRPPGTVPAPKPPAVPRDLPSDVELDGGSFVFGATGEPWAYDNERPAHRVDVSPFRLDTTPVTNGAYMEFMVDGGYHDRRLWRPEGWTWRQEEDVTAPLFWHDDGLGSWSVLRFGARADVDPAEPVQHLSWYEADAFARWAGRRLPTEVEWEYAATAGPAGDKRRWPWGNDEPTSAHANLGQRHDGPAAVGAYPAGADPWGVHQLVGDVWEWTASDFRGHPGFRSFPYKEYSEVFFGDDYKVLRGGSWATHPLAVRGTFRNWDFPIRRQIFVGFRTAADA
ncbi:MAG: ergothioneine biosynthesis protein EgtB [Acidimicrobiia bacterium]|nr:ergothioneine biosynthesis protein EgtB [Acidimicrobiia bacterium]